MDKKKTEKLSLSSVFKGLSREEENKKEFRARGEPEGEKAKLEERGKEEREEKEMKSDTGVEGSLTSTEEPPQNTTFRFSASNKIIYPYYSPSLDALVWVPPPSSWIDLSFSWLYYWATTPVLKKYILLQLNRASSASFPTSQIVPFNFPEDSWALTAYWDSVLEQYTRIGIASAALHGRKIGNTVYVCAWIWDSSGLRPDVSGISYITSSPNYDPLIYIAGPDEFFRPLVLTSSGFAMNWYTSAPLDTTEPIKRSRNVANMCIIRDFVESQNNLVTLSAPTASNHPIRAAAARRGREKKNSRGRRKFK